MLWHKTAHVVRGVQYRCGKRARRPVFGMVLGDLNFPTMALKLDPLGCRSIFTSWGELERVNAKTALASAPRHPARTSNGASGGEFKDRGVHIIIRCYGLRGGRLS